MGFAIPINEAKPIIEDLINNKKVLRPYLGIQGITISKEEAEEYKLTQGVYVRVVIPGSGADAAGVRRGDIITKIDDKKVLTIEDLIAEIQKHKVGDTVKIEVYNQGNEYKTLNVKLTASND